MIKPRSVFAASTPLPWIIFLPLVFCLYAASFSGYRIVETSRQSVLGETDAASFIILIRDFHLDKKYGDPFRLENRDIRDIAQKHKIHHILYVICASLLFKVLSLFFGLLGITQHQALYSVNAVIGCLNIFCLYLILKEIDPEKTCKAPFIVIYAFSLSTWIFSSVPDSWPFSATLMLVFLILHIKGVFHPYVLAVGVGIFMLNNIFLGTLCLFLICSFWRGPASFWTFAKQSILSICLALATWFAMMSLLSVFDPSFRPDHFFQYTLWFKKNIAPPVILFDTYYWKSSLTNLYINSFVSNQSNPDVPQESLLYTFQQSRIGALAVAVYLIFAVIVFYRFARGLAGFFRREAPVRDLLQAPFFQLFLYASAWLFLTVMMDTSGGFLYSNMTVPLMVVLFYKFSDPKLWLHQIAVSSTIVVMLINNADQVLKFREVLAAMSQ